MRASFVNPPPARGAPFIREGRCMQSADSWAAVWPPLTLAVLAAMARERGWEVDLIDGNVEPQLNVPRLLQRIEAQAPQLVLLNAALPALSEDAACAAAIKRRCPETRVVGFGGVFTLLGPDAMEAMPAVDLALCGEPEQTFAELLRRLEAGRELAGLAGLMWRDEAAQIRRGPARPFLEDLDSLPLAARDLLRNRRYRLPHNGRPFTLINVARGCPYPCIFCIGTVYYGDRLRRHSVRYVLDELGHCQQQLGLYDFLFWEEIFTLDVDFGVRLCEGILARGWDISWATTTRADLLQRPLLQLMKRAGCSLLGLGIESAHQQILDAAGKRCTVEQIRRGVVLCHEVGMPTMGHLVFGLPGETPETAEQTMQHVLELGLDYIQCYPAVPAPGTTLGTMARERGWLRARRWEDYDFGGASVMDTGTITPAQVDEARRRMYRRFYLRPRYVARQLVRLARNPRQLLQASRFLNWIRGG